MIDLFNFQDRLPRRGDVHICVIDQAAAVDLISLAEIDNCFFGHVLYGDEVGKRYVGVWGKRTAAKFRKTLQARGANIRVHASHPPARLIRFATQGSARAEALSGS